MHFRTKDAHLPIGYNNATTRTTAIKTAITGRGEMHHINTTLESEGKDGVNLAVKGGEAEKTS